MAAIYSVFTSPHHTPLPNHLPTLIITPHGQPQQILYSYLHTDYNTVNYLLTPSPQGDLCVAKLFPPPRPATAPSGASDPGHSSSSRPNNTVRCEASRELRWTIENAGVRNPIYKIVNSDETPLYQISKPNPNADFWTMFYFAYAGHQIPPRRVEFGKVSKNSPERGGGTRITITGKTEDEKKVWQTLGEGNEDCVEWVVACACLNLLDDEILKAAERKAMGATGSSIGPASTAVGPASSTSAIRPGPSIVQPSRGGPGIASSSGPSSLLSKVTRSNPNMGNGGPPAAPGPGAMRSTSADPRAAGGVSVPIRQGQPRAVPPPQMGGQPQRGGQPQLAPLQTGAYHQAANNGPRSADPYVRDPRYQQQQQPMAYSAGGNPPPGHPQYSQPQRGGPQYDARAEMRSPQSYAAPLPQGRPRPGPGPGPGPGQPPPGGYPAQPPGGSRLQRPPAQSQSQSQSASRGRF